MARWKVLLPLLVLAPLLAYVVGTLAVGSDGPRRPTPVILEQSDRDARPPTSDTGSRDDARDDRKEPDDSDDPVVVTPRPTEVEDDETAGGDDDTDDAGGDTDDTDDADTDDD